MRKWWMPLVGIPFSQSSFYPSTRSSTHYCTTRPVWSISWKRSFVSTLTQSVQPILAVRILTSSQQLIDFLVNFKEGSFSCQIMTFISRWITVGTNKITWTYRFESLHKSKIVCASQRNSALPSETSTTRHQNCADCRKHWIAEIWDLSKDAPRTKQSFKFFDGVLQSMLIAAR